MLLQFGSKTVSAFHYAWFKKGWNEYQQNDGYKNECLELRDEILNWYGLLDIAEGDGDNSLALEIVKRSFDDQGHRY